MKYKDVAECEESDSELAKYTIASPHEEINKLRDIIKHTEELNPYSSSLSFDYYQLHELESKLERLSR